MVYIHHNSPLPVHSTVNLSCEYIHVIITIIKIRNRSSPLTLPFPLCRQLQLRSSDSISGVVTCVAFRFSPFSLNAMQGIVVVCSFLLLSNIPLYKGRVRDLGALSHKWDSLHQTYLPLLSRLRDVYRRGGKSDCKSQRGWRVPRNQYLTSLSRMLSQHWEESLGSPLLTEKLFATNIHLQMKKAIFSNGVSLGRLS